MTVYRVGAAGATVFAEDGRAVAWLRPGLRVVEEPSDGTALAPTDAKRIRVYSDKRIGPSDHEDKAT